MQPGGIESSPLAVKDICEAKALPCVDTPAKKVTTIRAAQSRRETNLFMVPEIYPSN